MHLAEFLLDHRYTVSLVMGALGVLIAIGAIVWPCRKPVVRITDWHVYTSEELGDLLGLGDASVARMRREGVL